MQERPSQPPEGKLIAGALECTGLSIREASRRAGISYGRWRQITTGYQNVSPGSYAAVRAPARTVARMARVVGVSPERLEAEGDRPDAAAELRKLLTDEPQQRATSRPPDEDGYVRPVYDDPDIEELAQFLERRHPLVPQRDVDGLMRYWQAMTEYVSRRNSSERRGA